MQPNQILLSANVQLFGFSGSPSSNRIRCRSGGRPFGTLEALECESLLEAASEVDGDGVATSSISCSFSGSDGVVSTSFSRALRYAARELSSPTVWSSQ